jgi:hypothetical protein
MILELDRRNESEEEHGKFDEMKTRILNKSKVLESLMNETPLRRQENKEPNEGEDFISLAKRLDRELQL